MNRQWLQRWMPLFGGVLAAQLVIQALSAGTGILIVRTLPRESAYAWFTIASSMMAVISLLSDAGTGVAANALGGPVWQDRKKFSQIIAAIMRYRRWLVGIAAVVALPWTLALFIRVKAPAWDIFFVTLVIMISAWPSTCAQVYGSVNRLHSRYRPQLTADMAAAFARLLLTVACLAPVYLLFGRLNPDDLPADYPVNYCLVSVVLATCLSNFLHYHLVKSEAKKMIAVDAPLTHEFDARIKQTVRHIYPTTLFYCLQGQLSTWLMGIFGSTAQVADIGALSRISIIFAVAGAPIFQIAGPAFARCTDQLQLKMQFWKVCALYAVFALGVLVVAFILPAPILWVLGPQYSHLGMELRLTVLGLIVSGYSGITWGLAMARGWVRLASLAIPLGIASQVAGLFLFKLSTVSGVLGFNVFTNMPSVLLACFIVWQGFRHWQDHVPPSAPDESGMDASMLPPSL